MNNYTLYRVVPVTCAPIPGVREEKVWTHDYDTCPFSTDVDRMAEALISAMDGDTTIDRVEWDQDGQHYLLRRTV